MTDEIFLDGRVVLKGGDCRERLKELADNSVDAVVCDPPYALASIVKRFGADDAAPATPKEGSAGAYARASAGFMGQKWDTGETAFAVEFWREVFRVLKPGGHVVAFSGTRTYHHMAVAIEDAGFEIRDQLAWTYGTGFPKSHNVSKAIDKALGAEREKVRIDASAVGNMKARQNTRPFIEEAKAKGYHEVDGEVPASPQAVEWDGWGTALKPAWEPIALARKPCAVPDENGVFKPATVADNVMYWGTGAINVGACKIAAEKLTGWGGNAGGDRSSVCTPGNKDGAPRPSEGRFPANIMHDGSAEVVAAFPELKTTVKVNNKSKPGKVFGGGKGLPSHTGTYGADEEGSAARFFYSAKADSDDRLGFNHPTVKPVDVMRWLVRLVCRKGGLVVDPFAGTGTTGAAAYWEGCNSILCEREDEYQGFIRKRMSLILAGPEERKRARTIAETPDALPLFGG